MNYLSAVNLGFPDAPSGAGRVAWDIAKAMRDKGYQATTFSSKYKQDAKDISEHEGIRMVRFTIPKTLSLDPFKLHKHKMEQLKAARKYLVGTKWDIVHSHLPLEGQVMHEVFGEGPRYIHTIHSPIVMEQEITWAAGGLPGKIKLLLGKTILKRLERDVLSKVHKIHTLSEFTKQQTDKAYGLGDKITVIPHWCREDFFRKYDKSKARCKLNWPENSRIIFTLRRLVPRMGLDIAVKALAPSLKKCPNALFVLAGAGPLEKHLKQLAENLGVADKVLFLGCISEQLIKRCYEAADLFLLPTRALECFGLPILESLAYGLPIISTDAAAIPELMTPILPECIVPAADIERLREKLTLYMANKLVLPDSETLIKYVQEHFGKNVIIPRMVDFLESN
jgi:glycosyltransferase involved in cell wall biosynthesis